MYISVVIPLYNKEGTIYRAMNSVIQQLTDDVELIVVDDGSTDGSRTIAESLQQAHPAHHIRVHAQTNGGVSAARNAGIDLAKGSLVAFLDADDTYDEHFLAEIKLLTRRFPDAAVFSTSYRFCDSVWGDVRVANISCLADPASPQILPDFFRSAAAGDLPVTSSSVCINKEVLIAMGGFPEQENMGEDQAVWSQLALQYNIAFSPRVCATYYEAAANSLMQSVSPIGEMPFSQRLQQQLEQGVVPAQLRTSLKRYIAIHLFDLVRRNLLAGNRANARQLLSDPRTKRDIKRWFYWQLRMALHSARISAP
ncbi:MAG: glycosyltransferase family 2 protein [Gammaproteobacteria bacterium]|nr:glycosyltransferase family 2 protein [Gammaproteobacteria bacterium]